MIQLVAHLERRGDVPDTRAVSVPRGAGYRQLLTAVETAFDVCGLRVTAVSAGSRTDLSSSSSVVETWELVRVDRFFFFFVFLFFLFFVLAAVDE